MEMHGGKLKGRDGWCILRTAGPRTIGVANSLASAGFEAWTPRQVERRRRPRRSVVHEIEHPIIPTFVFAKADRLADLMRIASTTSSAHPPFSVFRYDGRIPIVADSEMASLRAAEERARLALRKTERRTFQPGQRVRADDGAFAGMTGIVEDGDGKYALVSFGGSFRVKIATWLLAADDVENAQPVTGIAAQAARSELTRSQPSGPSSQGSAPSSTSADARWRDRAGIEKN